MIKFGLAVTAFLFVALNQLCAQADERDRKWNQPITPFRIAGNLYYVGAVEITSYLITTPEGHFLLDGGFVETAPLIARNIQQLGFKLTDVKFLINSHAHYDHASGLAELKKLTGAKFLASEGDAELLRNGGHGDFRFGDRLAFPPVVPDKVIRDAEPIQLADQIMVPYLTPGHTKGTTTWTTKIRDGDKSYDVVFVGSQSSLDYQFVGQESYPGILADFEKSFATLNRLPCDIFLASHGNFFHLVEKHERLLRGETTAFVDPEGYKNYLRDSEKDFREKLARQKNPTRD
ncbi:MAG TPA: subclass B3 metallo-beta-lactamase [Chthoniobacterales bacterium]|nr:subclass B3 metallo-beta-lactamase [Chthoniobacterales bacterium]